MFENKEVGNPMKPSIILFAVFSSFFAFLPILWATDFKPFTVDEPSAKTAVKKPTVKKPKYKGKNTTQKQKTISGKQLGKKPMQNPTVPPLKEFPLPGQLPGLHLDQFFGNHSLSGWSGGGAGFHNSEDNIWFLGSEPVEYCVQKSAKYPFNNIELKHLVAEALNDWRSFFRSYGMDQKDIQRKNRRVDLTFHDRMKRGIALNFIETDCSDIQKPGDVGERLVFTFGKSNPVIDNYRTVATENALGVAVRQSYNHVNYRTGGFVWIGKVTHDRNRLKHLLLHELGHVFGMKHDSVFVMDGNMATEFVNKKIRSNYFGRIESLSWKYRLREGDRSVLTAKAGKTLPGNVLRRISNRVRRILGSTHLQYTCEEDMYMPNILIPRKVLKQLGMQIDGCHKVILQVQEMNIVKNPGKKKPQNTAKRENGKSKLILIIEDLVSRQTHKLVGNFEPGRVAQITHPAPGVFSHFLDQAKPLRGNKYKWRRITLDEGRMPFPARGFFKLGGMPLAAQIDHNKGPVIEIFIPQSKKWWVIHNIHNDMKDDL